jgi:hypothetical protein
MSEYRIMPATTGRRDGPCVNCELAARCRDYHLACEQFWCFVTFSNMKNPTRAPTREIYDRIYSEEYCDDFEEVA